MIPRLIVRIAFLPVALAFAVFHFFVMLIAYVIAIIWIYPLGGTYKLYKKYKERREFYGHIDDLVEMSWKIDPQDKEERELREYKETIARMGEVKKRLADDQQEKD